MQIFFIPLAFKIFGHICRFLHEIIFFIKYQKSRSMRKPTTCICKNKGADQLRSNSEPEQHLCFRYKGSTIPLHMYFKDSKFPVSRHLLSLYSSVCVDSVCKPHCCFSQDAAEMHMWTYCRTCMMATHGGYKKNEPVHEKTNNLGSDQVRYKWGCTVTEDG